MKNIGVVGFLIVIIFVFTSCASSKKNYSPAKKYAAAQLQADYILLKNILQKKHPALYWYTPQPKMDIYFDKYYAVIKDSMTEQQFAWLVLAPLINKIYCGHTSVSLSKNYSRWIKNKFTPSFPLYLKVWNDSMVVYANLNQQKDTVFKKGFLVTSINGIPTATMLKYMLAFLPQDGYASNVSYHRLSANFPYYHRNIFGLSKMYTIGYTDTNGAAATAKLPLFIPAKDTSKKDSLKNITATQKIQKLTKKEKLLRYRNFTIDSSSMFATLTLNTFSNGRLRKFFRQSFNKLAQQNIANVIVDIRQNGGGRVNMSTLLTKYISRLPFKIADSAYATARGLGGFHKYFTGGFFNSLQMWLTSRKKSDGNYHLTRVEKHLYAPKKNNYKGKVYVVISGPTFSAATLFCNAIKGQQGITLVGEPTGGGWYGNSGIIIPDVKLPNSGLRVRMPLYKMVQVQHGQLKGQPVMPDVLVPPSYDALINGYDKKLEVIKKLIGVKK